MAFDRSYWSNNCVILDGNSNTSSMKQNLSTQWLFILFPALAMMLGWGLRGHIGGGPFGAMIPGAMLGLSLGILLKLPTQLTAILTVFGVVGIGLGGEMTYGQTLGFLRNPDTVWWGLAGTTLKGGVWGLLGGVVFSLGFLYHRIPEKVILVGFLIMLAAFLLGFKMINDPKLLYFSGPDRPRDESWGALLMGAIALLMYYKTKLLAFDFSLIRRFAIYGLVGGALGFGLGSLFIVINARFPHTILRDWWKMMEFTFGFLLGGAYGLAAWKSRETLATITKEYVPSRLNNSFSVVKEILLLAILAIVVHAIVPYSLEPIVDSLNRSYADGFGSALLRDILRMVVNYGFFGLLMVLVIMKFPEIAWQIGIALTFSHAAIDLIRDFYPDRNVWSPFSMHFILVGGMTLVVSYLTAYYRRRKNTVYNLFLVLIWSCIAVSLLRLFFLSGSLSVAGLTFLQIVLDRFFVDLYFLVCAIILTVLIGRFRKNQPLVDG